MVSTRNVTDAEILFVHTKKYLDTIKIIPSLNDLMLEKMGNNYNSVYLNKNSYYARLSVGGVVKLCSQVISGKIKNGIAIVRPPGHHTETDEAMGFCILNNVAIAAKTMIEKHKLGRIVIIDWDVHHRNTTQHMFEDDPRVLEMRKCGHNFSLSCTSQ